MASLMDILVTVTIAWFLLFGGPNERGLAVIVLVFIVVWQIVESWGDSGE